MFWLNKIVWFCVNPLNVILMLGIVALVLISRGRRRAGLIVGGLAVGMLWLISTPLFACFLGGRLERDGLRHQQAESLPTADAIVVLGGGIGKVESLDYPDLYDAADRVWHAARLYRAGRAPLVVVSGNNEEASSVKFLLDLGVPREAILVDNASRNTYENSRFTEQVLAAHRVGEEPMRVLLVTSAWHMPRACGNFSRTQLRVTPAPTDFKAESLSQYCSHWYDWLCPSADTFLLANLFVKEWLGRLAKR